MAIYTGQLLRQGRVGTFRVDTNNYPESTLFAICDIRVDDGTLNSYICVTGGFWPDAQWQQVGSISGLVASVVAGDGIAVDDTDPVNPIVSATGADPITDAGYLQFQATGDVDSNLLVRVIPPFSSGQPAGQFQSHPSVQSDFDPNLVFGAGDGIGAYLSSDLLTNWDGVDYAGQILVWDLSGANLLQASFAATSNYGDSAAYVALSQVQLIGTDLSVSEDTFSVISAGGGTYSVQVRVTTTWD